MSATVRILLGALPWIVYAGLLRLGPTAAAGAALACAALLVLRDLRRRRVKVLEAAALPYLAMAAAAAAGGWSWPADNAYLGIHLALAAVAWGSLAWGAPFTLQYAREDWPREYWATPQFRRINALITALWGGLFSLGAAAAWLAPHALHLIGPAAMACGVLVSTVLPRFLARRSARRLIAESEPHDWPTPALGKGSLDVAVVGAGIGGLTAAALLARGGAKVTVLEAHDRPGGYCSSWERRVIRDKQVLRFVFDAGVHEVSGLGERGAVRRVLRHLGVADRLDWRRVGRRVAFPGLTMDLPESAGDLVAELQRRFPGDAAGVAAFFGEIAGVFHDLQVDAGLPGMPKDVDSLLAWPKRHPHAFRWQRRPFQEMVGQFVTAPPLRSFLLGFTPYLTDRPEALTVTEMAPIFGYCFDGGWYPAGGSQQLAEALCAAIRRDGGSVRLRCPVRRIVTESGRAAGVLTAEGEHLAAGAVVHAGEVTALPGLCPDLPPPFAAALGRLEPSPSAMMVTLGLRGVPDLPPLVMGDGFALAIPSLLDAALAPPGHAAAELICLVPHDEAAGWRRDAPDYGERKRRRADDLVARAEALLPGLSHSIVYREDASPASFARYARTAAGAIYGPALGQPRPAMKTPIPGLVLAGAAAFPGAGVEAVMISGGRAAAALQPAGVF